MYKNIAGRWAIFCHVISKSVAYAEAFEMPPMQSTSLPDIQNKLETYVGINT